MGTRKYPFKGGSTASKECAAYHGLTALYIACNELIGRYHRECIGVFFHRELTVPCGAEAFIPWSSEHCTLVSKY